MTAPHFDTEHVTVYEGDCIDVMRTLPDASVDAVVTDPPYGINFMGKDWDTPAGQMVGQISSGLERATNGPLARGGTHSRGYADNDNRAFQAWCELWAIEAFRLLKPGGHLLAFGGTRTFHRLASGIEDAGFEIRDSIAWLYGSGFPKSLDVSKAIDKTRDDRTEVLRVQRFLEAIRTDRGLPLKAINQHFGFAQNGGGPASKWTANSATPAVPSDEQWAELGEWLGFRDETMTALVARLNARKGEGSDEWNTRPAADYSTGVGMGQSWRNGEGWTGASARGGTPVRDAAKQWQGWGTAMKPAHEPVVVARKPLQSSGILATIGSHLDRLEAECRHVANGAGPSSAPTRPASPAATTATAPGSAATPHEAGSGKRTPTGTAAGSSDPTATSASESTAATFSNTVTSWRACWVELSEATSTSTTSTTTRPTTDLETLSSCLSRITLAGTGPNTPGAAPSRSLVEAADALFAASVLSSRSTRTLTAIEPATEPDRASGAANYEPIVVARKPLAGTVAANVLAYGTGALNIDASRIAATDPAAYAAKGASVVGLDSNRTGDAYGEWTGKRTDSTSQLGRWPANVVLDASQAAALDLQSGVSRSASGTVTYSQQQSRRGASATVDQGNDKGRREVTAQGFGDEGGASRFFKTVDDVAPRFMYTAKAGSDERPVHHRKVFRLRADLTPEQADHVLARLRAAGVQVD